MRRRMSSAAIIAGFSALAALMLLACEPRAARAATTQVNFETVPGGAPSDGLAINTQYSNVTFSLEGDGSPVLAEVGGVATAFFGPPGQATADTPAPNQHLGNFVLTDDGVIVAPPRNLIITAKRSFNSIAGDLLDTDNNEVWIVQARDKKGNVIDSVTISHDDPNTGDGIATPFAIVHPKNDIFSIRFQYAGQNADAGFAFDNFTGSTVPLPAAAWSAVSLLSAMGGIGGIKRLRRARR